MDIPRYRIGNDLTVLWAISNNDGTPYDLSGKEVRLYITNERGMSRVEPTIVQDENSSVTNIIRWVFLGDNQKVLGKHTLTVEILTSDEHRKIKRDICDAFTLVSRSEEEETGGEGNAVDSSTIYLSSKLDVYRFGRSIVTIGTNGNWFIDGTDTGRTAMGGGPGLVHNIYNVDDLGKEFTPDSVIDTFNAYVINEIYKSLQNISFQDLAGLELKDLDECDVIAYIGESWVNIPFKDLLSIYGGGNSGGGGSGDSHWYLGNDGKLHTDYDIVVHGNALIDGDTSSGEEGEDNPVGLDEQAVLDLLEREKYVTEDDIAGLIPEIDLSDYYTTTQVDDLLSKKANTKDVYTKTELEPYMSWWDKLMAHITVDENGNVVIDPNLMVVGDVASGDEGEDVVIGGISGVKVNGVTYYDDNGDGIVDLGTISGGGGVSGDYLPLSGGTITGNLTLNQYLKISAWSGYGSGTANVWYNGSTKRLLWENATDMAFGTNLVIHSGNIGSYAVTPDGSTGMNATAFLTWGKELASTDTSDWDSILSSRGLRIISSTTAASSSHAPVQYSSGLHIRGRYGFQIAGAASEDIFYMRRAEANCSWKTLIHSGNIGSQTVAAAKKLVTSDGTDAITTSVSSGVTYLKNNGCIYINLTAEHSYDQGLRIGISPSDKISAIWMNTTSAAGYNAGMWGITCIQGGNLRFRGGASSAADIMNLTPSGNILIGTTTDNSSGAKLQVDGSKLTIANGTSKNYSYIKTENYSSNTARMVIGTCYGYGSEAAAIRIYNKDTTLLGAVTISSNCTIGGNLVVNGDVASA